MPRELEYPAQIELPITGSIGQLPARNAEVFGDRALYAVRGTSGWKDVSARQFNDQVRAVAKGLVARGIGVGDPVALLSPTRYEWAVVDFALWSIGSFAVPIYDSSSVEQIEWILTDSIARAVVVDTAERAVQVMGVRGPRHLGHRRGVARQTCRGGRSVADESSAAGLAQVSPDDPATIVYTSGTTGRPKGCVISHKNLMFVVRTLAATTRPVVEEPGARTVLFLPLAHVLGRGRAGVLRRRWDEGRALSESEVAGRRHDHGAAHVPGRGAAHLREDLQRLAAEGLRGGKGKIFERAAKVAIDYGRATRGGGKSSLWLRAQHAVFDRLVYSKLRDAMGGSLRYAITGGASLGERLGFFYAGIGLTVMEGYGLTETTASGTFNRAENPRIGSVGQPMPGTAVRIADDGEIWLEGLT